MSDDPTEELHEGSVREWHPEEGWGVLVTSAIPEPVWAHFSCIAADGYRELTEGQVVRFSVEQASQDSFNWRAVRVELPGQGPTERGTGQDGGPGYVSELDITFDQ
ncbi:cold-shock protein [Streptomyces sp. LS1784]|uniref:cold-shock protein n=1 Tax=Streptomyces sp. LS1784 TaxID=2851533 RepID=UPI001CCD8A78|nr:cold shock domain-containing protein [Streptomyces sp. LS1784]